MGKLITDRVKAVAVVVAMGKGSLSLRACSCENINLGWGVSSSSTVWFEVSRVEIRMISADMFVCFFMLFLRFVSYS